MLIAVDTKKLTTQAEAIIHFVKTMDIEMINDILDDHITYQDFEKYIFISKLQNAFETFKSSGDTQLNCHPGVCNSCNKGCKGFSFIGNISNNFLNIIVETSEGRIKDLYECSEFKNSDSVLIKNQRIYIDKFDLS